MTRRNYQDTMDRILLLIKAGAPVLYIVSLEEARVLDNLKRILGVLNAGKENPKNLAVYRPGGTNIGAPPPSAPPSKPISWLDVDPVPVGQNPAKFDNAADAFSKIAKQVNPGNLLTDCIAVFCDIHHELNLANGSRQTVSALRAAAQTLREGYDDRVTNDGRYRTFVIISPSYSDLAPELNEDVVKIVFPLPELDELKKAFKSFMNEDPPMSLDTTGIPEGKAKTLEAKESLLTDLVVNAGRGLPKSRFRTALNIFRAQGDTICIDHTGTMNDLKAEAVAAMPALTYIHDTHTTLAGLERIKAWITLRAKAIPKDVRDTYHLPPPRGVLLVGASGGGKSELAKLIANTMSQTLLRLDVASLFGSYLGETEENMRRALQLAEALAPCVLFVDEVEKAFPAGDTGASDGGVARRVFGSFLTWLSEERETPVFVVATANRYHELHHSFPEFFRKGRFDEIFWVGLPDKAQREEIFRKYLEEFEKYLDAGGGELVRVCGDLANENLSHRMTGAEIKLAIEAARFEAFRLDDNGQNNKFTPILLKEQIQAAKAKAMYRDNSELGIEYDAQEERATMELGWVKAN